MPAGAGRQLDGGVKWETMVAGAGRQLDGKSRRAGKGRQLGGVMAVHALEREDSWENSWEESREFTGKVLAYVQYVASLTV